MWDLKYLSDIPEPWVPLFLALGALITLMTVGAKFIKDILKSKDTRHDAVYASLLAMLAESEADGAAREAVLLAALDKVAKSNVSKAVADTRLAERIERVLGGQPDKGP